MKSTHPVWTTALAASLCACSSISSIDDPNNVTSGGLAYYMPQKDFVVTMTKAKGAYTDIALSETPAYPDLGKAYWLQFQENMIGKNVLNIGIGTNGLLTSSKSVTTSGLTDALKSLGESIGTGVGLAAPAAAAAAKQDTCADGKHVFHIHPGSVSATPCGVFNVAVKKLAAVPGPPKLPERKPAVSGIFYRQAEPYEIRVSGPLNTSAILFSPTQAPVQLLPISKTLFSNNDADFGFTDGMPTKYNQTTDGELIALFKLPAEVIGAYFGAIGKMFDSLKATDSKEAEVLAASIKLELAKRKYDLCLAAVQAKDNALVQQLECAK